MADTQSHTPGVIRSTRDYRAASPAPASPDEDAPGPSPISTLSGDDDSPTTSTTRDNPREIRNKAEKQRRDKLNQSIGELASMVPPVVAASRKIDKTGVLRLTAHYLRAHQYVFGDAIVQQNNDPQFSATSTRALLSLLNGFLLTTTYRGLIVVVSQNVQQYLGYTELDLLGQNVLNIVHEQDRQLMRSQLMPKGHMLGPNGELLVPDEPKGKKQVAEDLACEKRRFIVRFKKLGQRSEPNQYVTCHVEGSLRKSDRACRGYNRCCQMVRRARARGDNPCSSGNDVVFVGVVRLVTETFMTESSMESYRMEYRTRHSIDGQIIQTEQRISLVTGYMTHEVNGINAMNFMHRDDVRWVVIALRSMYDQHRLVGESCYRLMAKNGQFIYLKTRGHLEVDTSTRAVTSFVCTNTVVDEQEGKYLIKLMKRKLTRMVNNNEEPLNEIEESKEVNEQTSAVEDPRQLEQVILHLVTDLPSPQSKEELRGESPEHGVPPSARLAIIPPRKERIVSAIEKIYSVIKTFPKSHGNTTTLEQIDRDSEIMTYKQPASMTPQLTNDQSLQNAFTKPLENPMTRLPNFNQVYQLRPSEGAMSIQELNPYNPPVGARTSTTTMPAAMMPSNSYAGLATLTSVSMTNNNNIMSSPMDANGMKFNLYEYVTAASIALPAGPSAQRQPVNDLYSLPESNAAKAGTKRPREYTDLDAVTKKKNTEPEVLEKRDDDRAFDASFLDDAFTSYPHIETAMSKLEQALDPDFSELLVSKDVEDILHAIEGPSDNQGDL